MGGKFSGRKCKYPSPAEWMEMVKSWQQEKDKTKQDKLFVEMYSRARTWVMGRIWAYCGGFLGGAVSMEECEQEARMALLRCLQRFDTTKYDSFFAYYKQWIRHHLFRFLNKATQGAVNKPIAAREKVIFKNARGEELSDKEKRLLMRNLSLDEPCGEDNTLSVAELLLNRQGCLSGQQKSLENYYKEEHLINHLNELLECLGSREKDVLTRRFYGGETLQAVANAYGMSREAIRQIQKKSLKRLRQRAASMQMENPF